MANKVNEAIAIDEDVFKEIKEILTQIQYGSLEISIHNGRIVQLERREKRRIDKGDSSR